MDTYLALVRAQPLAMAMLQVAVLGTLGDLLGAWLAARRADAAPPARPCLDWRGLHRVRTGKNSVNRP